jgi:tetratricopeptide (TPR) repeat protein
VRAEPTGSKALPLDPSQAVMALEAASDREQIFELLLRAARTRTRFAAVLSVHADSIRGRRAFAEPGLDTSRVEELRFPRHTVPAFETAIASRAPSVGPLSVEEPFLEGLLGLLGGITPSALVLPVTVANRTVALVVAHRGDQPLALADVSDLFPLMTASSPALARVLATRTQAATSRRPTDTSGGYQIEVILSDVARMREAIDKHRKAAAWEELVEAIRDLIREGVANGDPDEDEQLSLLFELGTIESEHLGRTDRAVEAWQSALGIDSTDARVLDALQALYEQQGRWEECAELLEKRAALTDDRAKKITRLVELAQMAQQRLEDSPRAIEAYQKVLASEPSHSMAQLELEDIYTSTGDWQALAELLLDRASRHPDAQAGLNALESVAEMYEDKLGDARSALLVWVAIARRDPARPRLLEQLDRLATAADAWDEIIPECRALADELQAKDPDGAGHLHHMVGKWARDHAGNRDAALQAFEAALRLRPGDQDVLSEQLDLLRADGRWMDLIDHLSRRAELEREPARKAELHAELGDIYENQLSQRGEAIACYERAYEVDKTSLPVLLALHRLYNENESWAALGDLIPQLIDALAPTAAGAALVDLHVEHGALLGDRLGLHDEALHAFTTALNIDPSCVAAFQGIQRVYQATGQTDGALDAREAELDAAGQADGYAEVAQGWYERKSYDRAATSWQKLLGHDPANLAAHEGLATALRAGKQWPAFVVARHAHLKHLTDPAQRIAVLLEIGSTLDGKLDDTDGACVAYQEILRLDEQHTAALDALGRLHDKAGRPRPALEALQRLLDRTTDTKVRADLFQRIGNVHLKRDVGEARTNFAQALALDADNARAREGMARAHLQQSELVAAGEEFQRAAAASHDDTDRIRCLSDAAWLYRHRLDDPERARQCLQQILELDPEHPDAKQALADLLQHTQQWETLWPHLESEVERAKTDPSMTADVRFDILARAARCAAELGKSAQAASLYDQACAIEARPATLLERAENLRRGKQLEAASEAFHKLAAQHASALDRAQLATVHRRLAQIYTELAKPTQAQMFHQKVLELDPNHRETLQDLVELHLARNRHEEAIASLRTLAQVAQGAERVPYLERIGDLYRDKLKNPHRAQATYAEALEVDNKSRRVLQRMLDLQTESGQWKDAVATIGKFLEHESVPGRRAAYLLAAGEIKRTELHDRPGALADLEAALDELAREEPPSAQSRARSLEVFKTVAELATAEQSWKGAEQAYRRMIKRLPKNDPALLQMWDALGEIYRTHLQHYQTAIEAFEIAHSLDPEKSPRRARVLAELYAQVGKQLPAQVSERAAKLVETDPTNADAYRALGRSALEAGRTDEAWCVARALTLLKQAKPEEEALYRRHAKDEVRKATGILDEESWAHVRHAEEDRVISAIFAHVWEIPVALRAAPEELRAEGQGPAADRAVEHARGREDLPPRDAAPQRAAA